MELSLLILAAGMGSRYGSLKQMDSMGPNGETVLDYSVYDAIKAGFSEVIFIIRKDFSAAFEESIGAKFRDKIKVKYVYQELDDLPVANFCYNKERVKPWGTVHATLAAKDAVTNPFAIINADDFYGADSFQQMANYLRNCELSCSGKEHYAMVGYPIANTLSDHGKVNRGVCSHTDKYLSSVEEHLEISLDTDGVCRGLNLKEERVEINLEAYASMNFWGFTPNIFQHFVEKFTLFLQERGQELKSEYYIPTAVDELITSGQADCKILPTTSTWFGVTYPEDKAMVVAGIEKLIASGVYPANLWK